jgi:integrase
MLQQRPTPLQEWFPGWNLDRLIHTMSRVIQQASLQGVTFHILRHTFASHTVHPEWDRPLYRGETAWP